MQARCGRDSKKVLVIGYGSDLRRDDAAGRQVAERLAALDLPNVEAVSVHQLAPEHAEQIAQSRLTIFVDAVRTDPLPARLLGPTVVRLHAGRPRESTFGHAPDPATLLFLARGLYGARPRALFMAIPAIDMDFGETLSAITEAGVQKGVAMIQTMAGRRSDAESGIRRRVGAHR